MNILVIGASQGTGALAVRAALDKGHKVTAFARNPQKLALQHPNLQRVQGDFHQQPSVNAVVPGHEAVIITASATKMSAFKENPRYFSQGTGHTIEAMKRAGVKRLSVLSALGTGPSRALVAWPIRSLMIDFLLKEAFAEDMLLLRSVGLYPIVVHVKPIAFDALH